MKKVNNDNDSLIKELAPAKKNNYCLICNI